jgi:hypothetical protein
VLNRWHQGTGPPDLNVRNSDPCDLSLMGQVTTLLVRRDRNTPSLIGSLGQIQTPAYPLCRHGVHGVEKLIHRSYSSSRIRATETPGPSQSRPRSGSALYFTHLPSRGQQANLLLLRNGTVHILSET